MALKRFAFSQGMFLLYNIFCDIFCSFSWCLATAFFFLVWGCKEISYEKIGKQQLLSKHEESQSFYRLIIHANGLKMLSKQLFMALMMCSKIANITAQSINTSNKNLVFFLSLAKQGLVKEGTYWQFRLSRFLIGFLILMRKIADC